MSEVRSQKFPPFCIGVIRGRFRYAYEPKSDRCHQRTDWIRVQRRAAILRDWGAFCVGGVAAAVAAFFSTGGGRERARVALYQIYCRCWRACGDPGDRCTEIEV